MAELSTREKEIAAAAWRCFPANEFPKINYEALAKAAGINTAKTASNTWSAFKKKLSEAENPTRVDLTEREQVVARVAWLCVEDGNIPKINAAVMVEMGLFKTVKTATNTWWSFKKKLQAATGGNDAAAPAVTAAVGPSTAAPKTGKRKATAAAVEDTAAAPPVVKKPRKARKTKSSTQEKEGAAEETAAREPPAMDPEDPVDFKAYVDAVFFG